MFRKLLATISESSDSSKKEMVRMDGDQSLPMINAKNRRGLTALHKAAKHNNLLAIDYLLSQPELDINLQDDHGNTALHWAVMQGNIDALKKIFLCQQTRIIDLNILNHKEESLLHLAVFKNHLEIAKILLANKVNCLIETRHGTPLYAAVNHKQLNADGEETIRQSLTFIKIAKKDNILHTAAGNVALSLQLFQEIITACNPNSSQDFLNALDNQGRTPLYCAVASNNEEKVAALLTHTIDLNKGKSSLERAIKNGNINLAIKLGEHGALWSDELKSLAIETALLTHQIDDLLTLIALGFNPNVKVYPTNFKSVSFSSMISSSGSSSSSSSFSAIKSGSQANGLLFPGDTALHFAVRTGHYELAEACLKAEPTMVNVENKKGHTPAFLAIKVLDSKMAHLLTTHGDKINATTNVMHTIGMFREARYNTFTMKMASYGFSSKEHLDKFFNDPSYQLTEQQVAIKEEKTKSYRMKNYK